MVARGVGEDCCHYEYTTHYSCHEKALQKSMKVGDRRNAVSAVDIIDLAMTDNTLGCVY